MRFVCWLVGCYLLLVVFLLQNVAFELGSGCGCLCVCFDLLGVVLFYGFVD